MYVTYRTSVPAELTTVRLPYQTEILEYLDLCLDIGWPVTMDSFQRFCNSQKSRQASPDALQFSETVGKECCIVIGDWLKRAGVELSSDDQDILNTIYDDPGAELHFEIFHSAFQNKYLQKAHQIYVAHRVVNAIHTYNCKIQETIACYRDIHQAIGDECDLKKYPRTPRYYLGKKGSNAKLAEAVWKLNEVHRSEMHDTLYMRGDPFGIRELSTLLHFFYGDSILEPHPVLAWSLTPQHQFRAVLQENSKVYQRLLLSRLRFKALQPTADEIYFCENQQSGYEGWQETYLCKRISNQQFRRAVELFDLVTRRVFYEFVAPDGTVARTPIAMPENFACSSFTREKQLGGVNICLADDTTLKRYYDQGKQLEINPDTYRVTIHPVTESTGQPPWWAERMKRALHQHNADAAYEFYQNVEDPWRICARADYVGDKY